MTPPRIRARAGKGEDGKWYFEISLWDLTGSVMIGGEPVGTYGPFASEKLAKQKMREFVEVAAKSVRGPEGEEPNGVIDFKNGGEFRKFGEH